MKPEIGDKLFFAKRDNRNIWYVKEIILTGIINKDYCYECHYKIYNMHYPNGIYDSTIAGIEYVFGDKFFLTKEEAKNHILNHFNEEINNYNKQIDSIKNNIVFKKKELKEAKKYEFT